MGKYISEWSKAKIEAWLSLQQEVDYEGLMRHQPHFEPFQIYKYLSYDNDKEFHFVVLSSTSKKDDILALIVYHRYLYEISLDQIYSFKKGAGRTLLEWWKIKHDDIFSWFTACWDPDTNISEPKLVDYYTNLGFTKINAGGIAVFAWHPELATEARINELKNRFEFDED